MSLNHVGNTQKHSSTVGPTLAATSSAIALVTSKMTSLLSKVKRKLDTNTSESTPRTKRVKFHHQTENNMAALMPPGTTWSNNSCAYDATIVILHSIWLENPEHCTEMLRSLRNQYLTPLLQRFSDHKHNTCSLENARDEMRRQLMTAEPNLFPWGEYVGLDSVMYHILKAPQPILKSIRGCPYGHKAQRRPNQVDSSLFSVLSGFTGSTQAWFNNLKTKLASKCRTCGHALVRTHAYQTKPPVIALDISSANAVHPNPVIQIRVNGEICQY